MHDKSLFVLNVCAEIIRRIYLSTKRWKAKRFPVYWIQKKIEILRIRLLI